VKNLGLRSDHVNRSQTCGLMNSARCALGAGTRDEAANSGVAVTVDIGPHDGRAETVGWHRDALQLRLLR
jgi:hypothetical protein